MIARNRTFPARRAVLSVVLVACMVSATLMPALASAAQYNPLYIISDDNWRASGSMSQAEIQAFLAAQGSVLTNYSGPEGGPNGAHSQVVKPASQIIFEACQYWGVNPKLVLATLEKEQSLISQVYHAGTYNGPYVATPGVPSCPGDHGTGYHIINAMGCGCYKGSKDTHPGFGDQVWTGTQKLGQTTGAYAWYPGKTIWCNGGTIPVTPLNQPTWNLYTYTPYYPQENVWRIYVKYFGDPLGSPEHRPVYRFFNPGNGTHFYTWSEYERWYVAARLGKTYRYEGIAYSVDTTATSLNTVPLHRFYNRRTYTHFYTASEAEKNDVIARLGGTYNYEGVAYSVSGTSTATIPVHRFYNMLGGSHFYTSSEAERANVAANMTRKYRYEGIAFHIQP